MTVWHWVRHAPTHASNFVGWRDVPADVSDAAALQRLRAHLPQKAVLVSSDLERARQTAAAISSQGHDRLPDDPHLREMHFGLWDGMHHSDVSARDPVLSRQFWEEPGDVAAPGGETWNMAAERVDAAVRRINGLYTRRHIVAVAHFGVILTQLQRGLGLTAYETLAHRIDNCSVTSIDWSTGKPKVLTINHLP